MAAAGGGRPVTPEERRVQLIELADELISRVPREDRRLRKFIFYVAIGWSPMNVTPLARKLNETAFFAYTKAGAVVAFKDWFDKICPELAATKAVSGAALGLDGEDDLPDYGSSDDSSSDEDIDGAEDARRIFDEEEAGRADMDVREYVDDYFKPDSRLYPMMEVPLKTEEVYSPDCRIGPKRAAAEPDVDDAE